ncbi:MAG: hypothetical protein QOE81_943, partial [Verrucomicrobiota bacterium]
MGCTFAETPLSAISSSNWSPESTEVSPQLLDASREDDSWFHAELDLSELIPIPKRDMKSNRPPAARMLKRFYIAFLLLCFSRIGSGALIPASCVNSE